MLHNLTIAMRVSGNLRSYIYGKCEGLSQFTYPCTDHNETIIGIVIYAGTHFSIFGPTIQSRGKTACQKAFPLTQIHHKYGKLKVKLISSEERICSGPFAKYI